MQAVSGKTPSGDARPRYRESGKTYIADGCRPLVLAAEAGEVDLKALGRGGYPGRRLPTNQLAGLRSVGAWNASRQQSWGLPLHRNEGIELTFLASGKIQIGIEKRSLTLSHDELLVTRPWQPHRIGNPHVEPGELIWLILDVDVRRPHQSWNWPDWIVLAREDIKRLTRYLRENEQYTWPATPDIRHCFLNITKALAEADMQRCCSRMAVTINELLLQLLEMFRQRDVPLQASLTSAERSVHLFLGELEETLDEAWTVASMAEHCGLGPTRFTHYCRRLTNMSPAKYLNHARLQRAARTLRSHPERPVTEIALACGFSSHQYFTNAFRREFGMSPRAFRKQPPGAPTF